MMIDTDNDDNNNDTKVNILIDMLLPTHSTHMALNK